MKYHYIVNGHRFATQAQAIAYANFFHYLTGIVVAVEYCVSAQD